MSLFEQALECLKDQETFPPTSFKEYCAQHGHRRSSTARMISIQDYKQLSPELRRAQVMVLRMGLKQTRHAHFGLVRAHHDLEEEFFLNDEYCFDLSSSPIEYKQINNVPKHILHPFRLLGSLQEIGGVNFALACGLFAYALGIDDPKVPLISARGASTYTFSFFPHTNYSTCWTHEGGQVEVDTVFCAERNGRMHMFVVEAKHGSPPKGLAKHKLAYPVYVMQSKLPSSSLMDIVPVYMRSWTVRKRMFFAFAECNFADDRKSLSGLQPREARQNVYTIPIDFFG